MKLYTYFRSSSAYRARIALNFKGLDYEPVIVNLARGDQQDTDYRSINPQCRIPSLELEDGAVVAQSLAIIEYLDEMHAQPPLLPTDAIDRARVRTMAHLVACDIQPLNNLEILSYLKSPLGLDKDAVDQWYAHWIRRGFVALDKSVAEWGSETHCFGEFVTLADICLVPQMWNARRFNVDVSDFENLVRVDAALQRIDAFRRAAPENQPDTPSPA